MENIEKALDNFFQRLGHTPGPWKIENAREGGLIVGTNEKPGNSFFSVCKMRGTFPRTKQSTEYSALLIAQSPAMLRELCRAYLTMLVKFGYGVNSTVTEIRTSIWMQGLLASLCGQISDATGLDAKHVHDTFEQYATWIEQEE